MDYGRIARVTGCATAVVDDAWDVDRQSTRDEKMRRDGTAIAVGGEGIVT